MTTNEFCIAREKLQEELNVNPLQPKHTFQAMVQNQPFLPFVSVQEGTSGSLLDSCQQAVAAIFDVFDQWESLQARAIPGGNTNRLFCCSIPDSVTSPSKNQTLPDRVLVRVFGGTLLDRDLETTIYAHLADQKLALGYHGRFANGRLEEWSDHPPLTELEMRQSEPSQAVARAMAQLHKNFVYPSIGEEKPIPLVWEQLNDWSQRAKSIHMTNPADEERFQKLNVPEWPNEVQHLQKTLTQDDFALGFCHCDVLAANMLYNKAQNSVQLIDFEYGGWNYFCYDVANHFNEYAGGTTVENPTPDYGLFPSRSHQQAFARAYLQEYYHGDATTTISDQQVDEFLDQVDGFVMANHMVWSLWAVNQAATEGCQDFDYLHYAGCRMTRYQSDKAKYLEHIHHKS